MAIPIGCDHAGFELKEKVVEYLLNKDYSVEDYGTYSTESVDYPDFGAKLAMALKDNADARGIAICGSGIGISIAVNRFSWVRAALVTSAEAASLCRQHNDANVLALGERLIEPVTALTCVDMFLATEFEGGRHQRRVDKLTAINIGLV